MSSPASMLPHADERPFWSTSSDQLRRAVSLLARFTPAVIAALALIPVVAMLFTAQSNLRNVAYWDEIDSVLGLLLRIDSGAGPTHVINELFAITNEHRTVTSRLLFATSYWLTGTVNFIWFGAIGNAFIVIAAALLLVPLSSLLSRVTLGVVLGFTLFHLGHYESFLWSGSSIDHFQVVTLAAAALVAVGRGTRLGVLVGCIAAILATFTLAHGLVVWVAGALVLLRERRRNELLLWAGTAVLAAIVFFIGFQFNPGHHITQGTTAHLVTVGRYWLKLLGAPLAFGNATLAELLGAVLLVAATVRALRAPWSVARLTLPMIWFVIGSTALVAIGRAEFSNGVIFSRYLVLGGVAWALVVYGWIEYWSSRRAPTVALAAALPLLIAYNVASNRHYADDAITFMEHRDRAALRYRQHGADGKGPLALHPLPNHSSRVLAEADRRGIYRIPALCEKRTFPHAKPSSRIVYYVDELAVNERAGYVAGWAAIPGAPIERGDLHLVLHTDTQFHVFTTVQVRRPDVVKAYDQEDWDMCGFRFLLRRERVPAGKYRVGFLVNNEETTEFILTDHFLDFGPAAAATVARTSED